MPGNPVSASDSRIGATSFTIGNKIYMGTGLQLQINQDPKKDMYEYNVSTNTWVQIQPIPVQRAFAASFAVNGKGYIGSGNIASLQGHPDDEVELVSDFYQYDPTTDTWILKQSIEPSGRWGAVGFAINGKGYVAFGSRGPLLSAIHHNNSIIPLNSIREYDPLTNTWTSKASAQEGFLFSQVFVLNGKAYITGGVRINFSPLITESVTNTNEYNPANDTWTAKANLPAIINSTNRLTDNSRASAISFGLLDRGYLVSGQIWNNTAGGPGGGGFTCTFGFGAFVDGECLHKNILRYNPFLNIWTEISNSNPFDAQGIELAAFAQDDCEFGYATAGRASGGPNFKHFKFSDNPDGDYIQGPNTVCSSPNSTFNLQLSASGTVTWTTSSNLTIVSGQGTKNLIAKANTNGTGWVQASINIGCRVVTFPQKPVLVGVPPPSGITGPSYNLCYQKGLAHSGGNYSVVSPVAGVQYSWQIVDSNNEVFDTGDGTTITVYGSQLGVGNFKIKVRSTTPCGTSAWVQKNLYVVSCSGASLISVYPNPTSNELTVEYSSETEVFSADLVDSQGKCRKSAQSNCGKLTINISDLEKGRYFLHVTTETGTEKRQIVIDR